MLNCAAWLLFVIGVHQFSNQLYGVVLAILVIILALPFAWPFMFPAVGHHSSVGEIIAISVIVGVNSFAWGYGLAAIIRYCRRITFRSTEVADEKDIETQFQVPPPS
ncbi:hypothetical protein [Rubinisphaera sp.]|uniref:hypothetical protein n=1 Tax=Rubinisphaera sp. TaxID=2024857 RepID=UPI000C0EE3C6|nr:hypothetical protein [Rubinisphaera sp.]MBV11180.1 hypothetical protein [Rubinisphaera sp.]HCS50748.1 hypothetical protein [Planctomycetaceae bacterium]|tara:strand:- start:1907 stop:2227 length:321 start_codon:yes stop_codon:yes gene_type:complete